MSTLIIEKVKITSVIKHPNADKLDIIKCFDWNVITGRHQYSVGDEVIYIPVNTILTQELENQLFSENSKIKLNKHKIRTIKIRGEVSQGFVIDPKKFTLDYVKSNVSKYETPVKALPSHMGIKVSKKAVNKSFIKYTDIENFKYYDRTIQENEEVYISEKLHGTSFRAGWEKNEVNTFWKKLLNFFNILPEWEFCWGSRTVQIQNKLKHTGYYSEDVYTKMVKQYKLDIIIPKGFGVYGEIVGDNIQQGYNYGCNPGENKLFVYDIRDTANKRWLDYSEFNDFCNMVRLTPVPNLFVGPFKRSVADNLKDGPSTLGNQKIREGIVIKPVIERKSGSLNRVVLKYISEQYYLNQEANENSTEFN